MTDRVTPDAGKGDRAPRCNQTSFYRLAGRWGVILGASLFAGAFVVGGAYSMLYNPWVFRIALEHFAATVGLPAAGMAALCLVLILERSSGPMEFELLGLKFRGSSGPLVMWVFAFLSITLAVKLLW